MKDLFKNIFGSAQYRGHMVNEIGSIDELNAVLEQSAREPVFIFKHSTRCAISSGAAHRVDEFIESTDDLPAFYMLKVVENRPASNELAERLGVRHQSPQLILIRDGKAAWDASHHHITPEAIQKALQETASN